MVFYPSRAWLFLQGAMAFTFPVLGVEYRTGVFQEIPGLTVLEYVPFYALLLYGVFRSAKWLKGDPFPAPESLSVIIPTLNEAGTVERCLEALRDRPSVAEVVVVDGKSSDATADLAESYGVRPAVCEKGRGAQIAKGIEVSRGDIVTVLHADCLPDRGLFTAMLRALRRDGFAVGGAVGMRFEDRRWPSRWIAALNNFRTRTTAIAFGDQAQFFRRSVLDAVGGFQKMMLMEDVEFSLRLKEIGPVIYIPEGIRVSSRRWQGERFGAKVVTVLRLFFGFLIRRRWAGGREPGACVEYYRMYYTDR
jgi:rSAM/selenodomain-associated transferase 2